MKNVKSALLLFIAFAVGFSDLVMAQTFKTLDTMSSDVVDGLVATDANDTLYHVSFSAKGNDPLFGHLKVSKFNGNEFKTVDSIAIRKRNTPDSTYFEDAMFFKGDLYVTGFLGEDTSGNFVIKGGFKWNKSGFRPLQNRILSPFMAKC